MTSKSSSPPTGLHHHVNVCITEEVITTPEDVAVKCPHKINGPNWIPFKNNCYSFQLVASRWESESGQVQNACKKHSMNFTTLENMLRAASLANLSVATLTQ